MDGTEQQRMRMTLKLLTQEKKTQGIQNPGIPGIQNPGIQMAPTHLPLIILIVFIMICIMKDAK